LQDYFLDKPMQSFKMEFFFQRPACFSFIRLAHAQRDVVFR